MQSFTFSISLTPTPLLKERGYKNQYQLVTRPFYSRKMRMRYKIKKDPYNRNPSSETMKKSNQPLSCEK
jgi:hypothetical protein